MKTYPQLQRFASSISACVLALLLGAMLGNAHAEGLITHLSGPVQLLQANGQVQTVSPGTRIVEGQTLATGKGAYARLEMTDGGEMVLRPESKLTIEAYHFEKANPLLDNSVFRLLQGGLRAISGFVSKRGNRDAYRLITVTATIGIRGTQFDVRLCQANCGALGDGTYVSVRSGAIAQSNSFGELLVPAGQVGYAPPNAAPVRLPRDPGIGFTPPPGIPKLDEKKKLEAAAASAAAPTPAGNDQTAAGTTSSGSTSVGSTQNGATSNGAATSAATSTDAAATGTQATDSAISGVTGTGTSTNVATDGSSQVNNAQTITDTGGAQSTTFSQSNQLQSQSSAANENCSVQ